MQNGSVNIDKLSDRISSLVPSFIQEDAPVFEQFLKAYFEFLEAEILTLESQGELDSIQLEDGQGYLLVEPTSLPDAPDAATSRIIGEGSVSPFAKGEYIVGSKTKTVAKINVINGNTFYVQTISGKGFDKNETVTSRQGGQTGKVKSFKHNTVLASNQLLNYSDVDKTTEEFLDYFQKDFIPSLDLDDTKDARLTIKNINDLYQKKGTKESLEFLLRILYGQDAEIRYLIDETIQVSESGHSHKRRVAVVMDDINTLPSATDKIIQYEDDGVTIKAESIVENVFIINSSRAEYSIEITDNHFGTFLQEHPCTFVDRDGITKVTARVKGILSDILTTESSIYVGQEDNETILLESPQLTGNVTLSTSSTAVVGASSKFLSELKVGDTISYAVSGTKYTNVIATITDDITATITAKGSANANNVDYFNESYSGGLLNEHESFGSMYSLNDVLIFDDGKAGRDVVKAEARIDGLRKGGVEKVFIEDGGTGYQGGDIIVFDNSGADGNAAEAVIGAIEDVAILENKTDFGQFQITATAGQTLFNGIDDNGKRIIFNDNSVRVFVNGVEKVHYTDFTFKNDRVTFTSGQTAGHVVEIYTDFNNILYEDGDRIQLNTTESHIRNVTVTSPGSGYTSLPQCFPGGYIYLDDLTGYQVNEIVTGGTSNATATIVRVDTENGRLVVKRLHTDSNAFQSGGEVITGGTSSTAKTATQIKVSSGTGAKLLAYSDEIGGVGSINISKQGYNFKENQVLDSTSQFKMLTTTPTATLSFNLTFTGRITGSTGSVVNHNPNTGVLTFTNLNGHFLDNEEILFNSTDTFKCLKFNPFQARGLLGGEGIIERQLITLNSTLDESASNLHDGKFYQTHSYIVKVGESINKWRSIVKDLVHPAGHIFFGEVAVKNFINPHDDVLVDGVPRNSFGVEVNADGSQKKRFDFKPTIIMQLQDTYHFDLEFEDSILRDDESNLILESSTEVYVLDEDGNPTSEISHYSNLDNLLLEDSPDVNAITHKITELLVHEQVSSNHTLLAYDGSNHIFRADSNGAEQSRNENVFTFSQGHKNIIQINSVANNVLRKRTRQDTNPRRESITVSVENDGSQNAYVVNGVRRKRLVFESGVTYYFEAPSGHPVRLSTTADGGHGGGAEYEDTGNYFYGGGHSEFTITDSTPTTLYYYCLNHSGMGGEISVAVGSNVNTYTALNIDMVNNPSHSPYERRADLYRMAESGIILTSYPPFDEEAIVLEDGHSKIIIEEDEFNLRVEARQGEGLGEPFVYESATTNEAGDAVGDKAIELESGSYTAMNIEYMATERVQTLANYFHTTEAGETLVLEDGGIILDERTQGEKLTTYRPVGTTIGDINKISTQNVYDISYYLLNNDSVLHTTDEKDTTNTAEDHIVLEDGYGSVLLESSKESGLSIEDFDSLLPNIRMGEIDEHSFKRTNITYSSVVKSSNITNSTLSSL